MRPPQRGVNANAEPARYTGTTALQTTSGGWTREYFEIAASD